MFIQCLLILKGRDLFLMRVSQLKKAFRPRDELLFNLIPLISTLSLSLLFQPLSLSWPFPLSLPFSVLSQIECDLCGHRCMTQEGLDLHRLSHTGQTPLKCPVTPCRRRFASNAALEEHVLAHFQGTHTKAKNRPRFRCQICHKDFAYTSTFNVHMRTHTDERPFEVRKGGVYMCVSAQSGDVSSVILFAAVELCVIFLFLS